MNMEQVAQTAAKFGFTPSSYQEAVWSRYNNEKSRLETISVLGGSIIATDGKNILFHIDQSLIGSLHYMMCSAFPESIKTAH